MIAIFANGQQPCSPLKRKKTSGGATKQSPEDEEAVYDVFDTLAETLPRRHRAELQETLIGTGSGIAYLKTPTQSFAQSTANDVCAFFKGENFKSKNSTSATPAQELLTAYLSEAWDSDVLSEEPSALPKLSTIKSPYAFVIYDEGKGMIFAARDPMGREEMYWGSNSNGDLLFCTDRTLLEKSCVDADSFPAGALFISEADSTTGRIIDILPLLDEEDDEESQLCRSVSRSDLGGMGSRVPSQSQIAAM